MKIWLKKIKWFSYLSIAAVGVVFFYITRDAKSEINSLVQIPIVGSLVAALFQLVRDDAAGERAAQMERDRQRFSYGSQSQMAQSLFSKRVEFCEEYANELRNTVRTLYQEGPSDSAVRCANELFATRLKYALWLTDDVERKLLPFEVSLRAIGAAAKLWESSREGGAENRQKHLDEMYRQFAMVMGDDEWNGEELTADAAHASVLNALKETIGIERMAELQRHIEAMNKSPTV